MGEAVVILRLRLLLKYSYRRQGLVRTNRDQTGFLQSCGEGLRPPVLAVRTNGVPALQMTSLTKAPPEQAEFAWKLGRYFRIAELRGLMAPLFARERLLLPNRHAQASDRYSIPMLLPANRIRMLRKERLRRGV